MEIVINNEILDYFLKIISLLNISMSLLRKNFTCTNLLECLNDWCFNMQAKLISDVIYFDFKKAFDSVSHKNYQ